MPETNQLLTFFFLFSSWKVWNRRLVNSTFKPIQTIGAKVVQNIPKARIWSREEQTFNFQFRKFWVNLFYLLWNTNASEQPWQSVHLWNFEIQAIGRNLESARITRYGELCKLTANSYFINTSLDVRFDLFTKKTLLQDSLKLFPFTTPKKPKFKQAIEPEFDIKKDNLSPES